MLRHRDPRRLTLLIPALALAGYLGLPEHEAEAAKPQRGGGFDEGGYVMLTPGSLVLPVSQSDFLDLDPSFGWGFGGGYMFARGKLFKATVGGVFEHAVIFPDDLDFDAFGVHILRFMPEARIGVGTDKVWGYGLLGAGIAGMLWAWDVNFGGFDLADGRGSAPGFGAQFGGGVQGMVWKNLFLGGEVDVDVGLFFDDDNNGWRPDDDFSVVTVSFEFLVGWYF